MQVATLAIRPSSHREAAGPEGLSAIRERGLLSTRWGRTLEPRLRVSLGDLVASLPFTERVRVVEGGAERAIESLFAGTRRSAVLTWLLQDITRLTEVYLEIIRKQRCRVKLEVVDRPACRRFHYDFVALRLLCTYSGLGTLWVPMEFVDLAAIEESSGDVEADNVRIVRTPRYVRSCNPGDVLLLKGAQFPGHEGVGAVHRSPFADSAHPRLVLTIDECLGSEMRP